MKYQIPLSHTSLENLFKLRLQLEDEMNKSIDYDAVIDYLFKNMSRPQEAFDFEKSFGLLKDSRDQVLNLLEEMRKENDSRLTSIEGGLSK